MKLNLRDIKNKSHIMVANYFDMAFYETATSWSNWHFCQIGRLEFSSRIVLFNSRFTISTKPLVTFNMHWPVTRMFRLIVFLDAFLFTLRFHVMQHPKHCFLSWCSLSFPSPSDAFHFISFSLLAHAVLFKASWFFDFPCLHMAPQNLKKQFYKERYFIRLLHKPNFYIATNTSAVV